MALRAGSSEIILPPRTARSNFSSVFQPRNGQEKGSEDWTFYWPLRTHGGRTGRLFWTIAHLFVGHFQIDRLRPSNHTRSADAKQLHEGIADTLVAVRASGVHHPHDNPQDAH